MLLLSYFFGEKSKATDLEVCGLALWAIRQGQNSVYQASAEFMFAYQNSEIQVNIEYYLFINVINVVNSFPAY